MTVIPTLYLRGYSRTTPIMENGKYTGRHTPRIVPDGCRTLNEPYFAICASKRIELWAVPVLEEEEVQSNSGGEEESRNGSA
jgi:hypothetical protein